jgi:hypothetical protein
MLATPCLVSGPISRFFCSVTPTFSGVGAAALSILNLFLTAGFTKLITALTNKLIIVVLSTGKIDAIDDNFVLVVLSNQKIPSVSINLKTNFFACFTFLKFLVDAFFYVFLKTGCYLVEYLIKNTYFSNMSIEETKIISIPSLF